MGAQRDPQGKASCPPGAASVRGRDISALGWPSPTEGPARLLGGAHEGGGSQVALGSHALREPGRPAGSAGL